MNTVKEKHSDIITFIISVVLAAVLVFGQFAGKLSLAMASVVFYSGAQTQTQPISETKAETTRKETEPITEEVSKASPDITETPDDIKALIEKYTKKFSDDKKDHTF